MEKMGTADPELEELFAEKKRVRNPFVPVGIFLDLFILLITAQWTKNIEFWYRFLLIWAYWMNAAPFCLTVSFSKCGILLSGSWLRVFRLVIWEGPAEFTTSLWILWLSGNEDVITLLLGGISSIAGLYARKKWAICFKKFIFIANWKNL